MPLTLAFYWPLKAHRHWNSALKHDGVQSARPPKLDSWQMWRFISIRNWREPLLFWVCSVWHVSCLCCENEAVGGRWSNLSTPLSVWLYFFFSSLVLLLGYRRSDAENIPIDEMILNHHRKVLQAFEFTAADQTHQDWAASPRWPRGIWEEQQWVSVSISVGIPAALIL